MKIIMSKRKSGIYSTYFIVEGVDENNSPTTFGISPFQAKTYPQAVNFWNSVWGKDCKAFTLRNSEPEIVYNYA